MSETDWFEIILSIVMIFLCVILVLLIVTSGVFIDFVVTIWNLIPIGVKEFFTSLLRG